ncbi:MAG: exodeoxyribonuclease VII large subunit [Rhodothermia bacterium]
MQAHGRTAIISVSDLTNQIQRALESGFRRVIVEGEVGGFKRHSSGHCYFSMKEGGARLQCIMYRSDARRLSFEPADGMLVHAVGQISVYAPRGEYQLVARGLRSAGEGALRKAFEELKRRLSAEGLFDAARKRSIPRFPSTIGVVTSRDGAALQDIVTVLERRFPGIRLILKSTRVQGPGAAAEIAAAIRALNQAAEVEGGMEIDVLIVGRGGGSEEDLWPFNEEEVARAIFSSRIPVVSAVGHETDVSIADFVADLRAPTPSAAAELVVPDRTALENSVNRFSGRLTVAAKHVIRERRQKVDSLIRSHAFNQPVVRVRFLGQRLDELTSRIQATVMNRVDRTRLTVDSLRSRIESLDPRGPLKRGYVIVETENGPVTRASMLSSGDEVGLRFVDGRRVAEIKD